MLSKLSCVIAATACALLSGCLVPEKFDASISFNKDGTYVYRYSGTAANGNALRDMKMKGKLDAQAEEEVKAFAQELAKDNKEVKEIEYQGNARYRLETEETLRVGQKSSLIPLVKVLHGKGGTIVVASPRFREKDKAMLQDAGVKVEGTLKVTLPSGAKVVDQNADETPGWFSRTYEWKIGKIDKAPRIEFRMPEEERH